MSRQRVDAVAGGGAGDVHEHAGGDGLDFGEQDGGLIREVGLVERDDGLRAALPDCGEVALDAA